MRPPSISVHSYKMAQARVELPKFLKSRLALGTQARWQDFGRVDYFDVGPATSIDSRSIYGIESTQLTAYATLRPLRWMDINGQIGWMNPVTNYDEGPFLRAARRAARRSCRWKCRRRSTRATFPVIRPAASCCAASAPRYDDRTSGAQSFDKVEGEAAGFLPIAGGRVVLALHGWYVGTEAAQRRHRAVLSAAQSRRRQHAAIVHRLSLPRRPHAGRQRRVAPGA